MVHSTGNLSSVYKTITVANKLILFATNDNLETYQLATFDQYHQVIIIIIIMHLLRAIHPG